MTRDSRKKRKKRKKKAKENIENRERTTKNGEKVKQQQSVCFKFYFFIQKNFYFVRKHVWKKVVYIVTFHITVVFTWEVIGNVVIKH